MRKAVSTNKDESGVILILALFIITLLTVLVLEFSYTTRVEYHISTGIRDELLALNIAKAGVYETIALLRANRLKDIEEAEENEGDESEETKKEKEKGSEEDAAEAAKQIEYPDHYGEDWAQELYMTSFGEGFLSLKVIDESGKININRLIKEQKDVTAEKTKEAKEKEKEKEKEGKKDEGKEEEVEKVKLPRKWGQKDEDKEEGEEGEEEEDEYEEPARYVVDRNVEKVIIRLIETLDVRSVDPEEVTASIIDWMDSNDEGDWEDQEYGKDDKTSPPKNAPLDVLSELLMIKGVTGDLYYGPKQSDTIDLEKLMERRVKRRRTGIGLRDCLTVYSETKININTAPPEVIAALLEEENESLVKEIVNYTRKGYFEDLKQFEEEIGEHIPASLTAKIGVGSDSFQIISEGQVNDVKKQIRAYVFLDKDANAKILYWRVEE